MTQRIIVGTSNKGARQQWLATTLDKLGKDEKFLEDAIVASPELLGLESRRTGIRGPLKSFTQLPLPTPSGREIYPDIIFLTASGHVIVVEVKRYVNPELRDRAVIAQIIDYASSMSSLSEAQCCQLFGNASDQTWADVIEKAFPEDSAPDELSTAILERLRRGELNLVIACDKVPSGLPEVVSGIATQRTLGFDLDLVEIVPYAQSVSSQAEVLLVPSTRLATEVVSRTAVTVTYRQGDQQPSTTVQTVSLEDIEESVLAAKRSANPDAKAWTPAEVENEFRLDGNAVALELLDFAKRHSENGQFIALGKKQNAAFGFNVKGRRDDGSLTLRMVFTCVQGWGGVTIRLYYADTIARPPVQAELRQRL